MINKKSTRKIMVILVRTFFNDGWGYASRAGKPPVYVLMDITKIAYNSKMVTEYNKK